MQHSRGVPHHEGVKSEVKTLSFLSYSKRQTARQNACYLVGLSSEVQPPPEYYECGGKRKADCLSAMECLSGDFKKLNGTLFILTVALCTVKRRAQRECGQEKQISIPEDLTPTFIITSLVKMAQRRLYFLKTFRKINLSQQLLRTFYGCSFNCPHSRCCMVAALQHTELSPPLPALEDVCTSRCLRKTLHIIRHSLHPAHHLSELLPSRKCYRSIRTCIRRFMNHFYTKANTKMNSKKTINVQ